MRYNNQKRPTRRKLLLRKCDVSEMVVRGNTEMLGAGYVRVHCPDALIRLRH